MFNRKHKIGDTIAKLRKEKGWTQIELAEKLQVSDKAISKWESNKGDPSIEFLPAIAELFDVTLDYLMTGKEQKEKIVTMSKLELCAKKDDVKLYKEIGKDIKYKDENDKTIFDYIFKYESKELFKSLLPNAEHYISGHNIEFYENFYYMRILCNDMSVVRDLIRLEYIHTTLNNHIGETYKNIIGYNGSRLISIPRKIISDRIIDMILYSKNIDTSIKSAMFTNHKEQNYISPALLYPYFVLYALKKNDFVLVKELLENAVKINQENAQVKLSEWQNGTYLGFVNFPKEMFDILLENEKYDLIDLVNKNNMIYKERFNNNSLYKDIFVLTPDEIEANKIKHDKKLSDKEKTIKLCIHRGILIIDELLATKDYELIKNNLYKYPINFIEVFSEMIEKQDYKNIFKTAVDMGLDTESVLKEKLENFKKLLVREFWINGKSPAETWNRRPIDDFKKVQEHNLKYFKDWKEKRTYGLLNISNKDLTIDDIMTKLKESRDIIMQDLAFEEEKNKITKDLSKEFFESELVKNNIDRVVINLCVKLEAILKYDFRYDGDFQEMLSKYCETFNTHDDECNDYDPKTPRLLNKLRVYRNGMVHARISDESLTKDEIIYCINYICNLEKKGR